MKALKHQWFVDILEEINKRILQPSPMSEEERQEWISICERSKVFLIDLHNPPPNTHSLKDILRHPYLEGCFPKITPLPYLNDLPLELGVSFPYVVAFSAYHERFKRVPEGSLPDLDSSIILRWDMYGKPVFEYKGKALSNYLYA